MDVTGTWKGEYTFEETEEGGGKKLVGVVVTFTMKLKQGWFGGISGTVQDDPRIGFAEEGTIKGKVVRGKLIVLEKFQPLWRMMHDGSRITLEQWAERRKVVMDTKQPHPKIRHLGDIAEDGKSAEGTWLMEENSIMVPGSGERAEMPTLAGAWKMTRVE